MGSVYISLNEYRMLLRKAKTLDIIEEIYNDPEELLDEEGLEDLDIIIDEINQGLYDPEVIIEEEY